MAEPEVAQDQSVRNQFAFIGVRLLLIVVTFTAQFALIRRLPIEQYGAYSSALAISLLLAAFGTFGLDQLYLSRSLSEAQFSRYLPRAALGGALVGLVAAAAWPGLEGKEPLFLALLTGMTAFTTLRTRWLLQPALRGQVLKRCRREAVAGMLPPLGLLAGGLVTGTALGATVGGFLLAVPVTVWSLTSSRRDPGSDAVGRPLAEQRRRLLGFLGSSLMYTGYGTAAPVIVASLADARTMAHFRVALIPYALALMVTMTLNNDLLRPRLFREAAAGASMRGTMRQAVRLNAIVAALGAVCFLAIPEGTIGWALGPDYAHLGGFLRPLGLALAFNFANSLLGNFMVATGQLRSAARIQAITLVSAVSAAYAVVHFAGADAAAWAMVLTEMIGTLLFVSFFFGARGRAVARERLSA